MSSVAALPESPVSSAVRRRLLAISLSLVALTVAAFSGVVQCRFVSWDDFVYVSENSDVLGGINAASVGWAFTTIHTHNWHPLTWLSLQLDAQIFGTNPAGYHFTNLLLHAANVVLLFLVLHGMTGAIWRSAAVAALFAVHPLRVESVAWVSERKDVLSGFFWMLTMAAYLHYARRPCLSRYSLVFLSLALGLMAKPMLVTLPCVFFLLDYWPLNRPSRRLLWEKLPLLLLVLVDSLVVHAAQFCAQGDAPWSIRLVNALASYNVYLYQTFWPVDLCALYPYPRSLAPWWEVLTGACVLLAISAVSTWQARRRPYLIVGWLWYLGTLVPVLGLVQIGMQAHADRYTYIPLIGLFLMLVWGCADLMIKLRRPILMALPLAVTVLLLCVIGTRQQVQHWRTSCALWGRVVAVATTDDYAHFMLAQSYYLEEARLDEAVIYCRKAAELSPENPHHRMILAMLLVKAGRSEEASQEIQKLAGRGINLDLILSAAKEPPPRR